MATVIVVGMTGPFADRLFRTALIAAGIYNLSFGAWAAVAPQSFFRLFELTPPRYPAIWACLGMVVGVYGLLYWYAAWKLESAWPIVAVGLLGKVLGPIGMAISIGDDWPRRVGMLCVYNDVIWWLPFGLFLFRDTQCARWFVQRTPWLCVGVHFVAIAMLLTVLRHGGLTVPDVPARSRFVAAHPLAWTVGWSTWMLAAASLVGFYAWWGSHLEGLTARVIDNRIPTTGTLATAAVIVAAIGMVFDFSGEGLSILLLPELASNASAISHRRNFVEQACTLLSAGMANGLYTLGGALLTLITPGLPTWIRASMWVTWLAGAAMSVAAVTSYVPGLVVATVILFPSLIVWVAWMGACWRTT